VCIPGHVENGIFTAPGISCPAAVPDGSYRIKFDKKPEPAKSERTDRRSGKTETPPAPNQNTIYKFRARCETALCPRCDGENAPGANLCHICGQQLSMKGAYSL